MPPISSPTMNDLSTDELRDVLTAFDEMISSDVWPSGSSTDLLNSTRSSCGQYCALWRDKMKTLLFASRSL